MTEIFARRARLEDGWFDNVAVSVKAGRIASIVNGAAPSPDAVRVDALLPALSNLHSHAFQRAMAGRTEWRGQARDSFWTWRELMYRFAALITPEELEAIAAFAFMEMMEAGYAAVGEFHYLHHAPSGARYEAIDELSARVFAGAAAAGAGITLLPVLYMFGGAGEQKLSDGQRRFANDVDSFLTLVAAAEKRLPAPDARVGVAPHSLRATSPAALKRLLTARKSGPVHIHVAEQPKEVEDVIAWLGARPVEFLLDRIGIDARWCLVHATHMTEGETDRLAASGAVAGLCPVTEANLGDGPFNGVRYLAAKGAYGVGTDSNVAISMIDELRMLEYSQRLKELSRNVLSGDVHSGSGGHVGASLYLGAAKGGAEALGREAGAISERSLADLVAIDGDHPALFGQSGDMLMDALVFCASRDAISDVWSAGRHVVRSGRHIAREAISARYRKTLSALLARA